MVLRIGKRSNVVHVHRLQPCEASKVQNIAHGNAEDGGWNRGIRGRAACVYRVRDYPLTRIGMGQLQYVGGTWRYWVLVSRNI